MSDLEDFRQAMLEAIASTENMKQASDLLGWCFPTFKNRAIQLGIYRPSKRNGGARSKVPLQEILEGKHPNFQTLKLKMKLLRENLKKNRCEVCSISEWNGKPIMMELHHLNGNSKDHCLENLIMICPNCHAQTDNYRGANGTY